MVKFKSKIKNSTLYVRSKLSKEEEINEKELNFLSNNFIRGFLKPELIKRKTIEYTGPAGISLYDHIKEPISKYEFFVLIEQIIEIVRKIERKNLFLNKVVFDMRYIFINKATKELQFIYLPLVSTHYSVDVLGFIESVIYLLNPLKEQNTDYLTDFSFTLKDMKSFDADLIESIILKMDRKAVNTVKKQGTGSGFMTDKPIDYYKHYSYRHSENDASFDDEKTGLLEEYEDTELLDEYDAEATGLLVEDNYEDTGLLSDDDCPTGLLNEEDEYEGTGLLNDCDCFPTLYRILTEENISIDKPVFRLGKEKSYVDFFISNNNAISRSHADIITRGKRYYIIDLNSKNKTYVNGQAVPVKCEIELFNGDLVKLANEEFVFKA